MSLTKATVLLDHYGTDTVILATTFPASIAANPDIPLAVQFKATNGEGIEYVRRNFGIEPEVITVQDKMSVAERMRMRAAAGGEEEGL